LLTKVERKKKMDSIGSKKKVSIENDENPEKLEKPSKKESFNDEHDSHLDTIHNNNDSEDNYEEGENLDDDEIDNLRDIVDPEIKELIKERGLKMVAYDDLIAEKKERGKELTENKQKLVRKMIKIWFTF